MPSASLVTADLKSFRGSQQQTSRGPPGAQTEGGALSTAACTTPQGSSGAGAAGRPPDLGRRSDLPADSPLAGTPGQATLGQECPGPFLEDADPERQEARNEVNGHLQPGLGRRGQGALWGHRPVPRPSAGLPDGERPEFSRARRESPGPSNFSSRKTKPCT